MSDQPAEPVSAPPAEIVAATEPAVEASAETAPEATTEDDRAKADRLVAEGKKAIALKQWEEGVAKYADALEVMGGLVGETDPAMAPLLLSYGKALYELAFSQSGVMGKDEVNKAATTVDADTEAEAGPSGSNFVFEEAHLESAAADEEEGEAEGEGEGEAEGEGEGDAEEGGKDGDEPEDDFNAAWEVLDVARTIYQKLVDGHADGEGKEDRLNLAECYIALGDVSCETENFPQAVQDYTAALAIKSVLLPSSSRALASVHYQLATVLEFTPSGRSAALSHVESALSAFKARLAELDATTSTATIASTTGTDDVLALTTKEREAERADVAALIGDLEVKIDELKAAPPTEDLVSESINHLLGGIGSASSSSAAPSGPVNDLTSMVRKKKKVDPVPAAQAAEANGKRKAEEEAGAEEKKAKAE